MICPICREEIEEQSLGSRGSINSCKNFCFDKFDDYYPSCPICNEGKLSERVYHGTMYIRCNNKNCNFELRPETIFSLMNKGFIN